MADKKKILIWEGHEYIGGGQKMSLMIYDMLNRQSNIKFLVPGKGALTDALDARAIPYVLIPSVQLSLGKKKVWDYIRYLMSVSRAIRTVCRIASEERPDILYVPGPYALPLSALVGKKMNVPVVWHLHHIFQDKMTVRLLNSASKTRSVKAILSVSEIVGAQIHNSVGQKKVKVLYNPVDMTVYQPGTVSSAVKAEFGLEDGDIVLEHIGFLIEPKKQEISIRALKRLREMGYPAKLMLIGDSRPGEPGYKERLVALVKELGVEEYVIFTGHRNDVNRLLKAAVVVVVVMSEEGCPLAGLEAMATRIPLAAVDTGGAAELVKRAGSGCLFSPEGNIVENCALAVKKLLDDPKLRGELSENGYRFTKANDINHYRDSLCALFQSLADTNDRG